MLQSAETPWLTNITAFNYKCADRDKRASSLAAMSQWQCLDARPLRELLLDSALCFFFPCINAYDIRTYEAWFINKSVSWVDRASHGRSSHLLINQFECNIESESFLHAHNDDERKISPSTLLTLRSDCSNTHSRNALNSFPVDCTIAGNYRTFCLLVRQETKI